MKKNKLLFVISFWLLLSIVATYLKLTHSFTEISQVLLLIVLLLSIYIIVAYFNLFNRS
jgi:hypothetical protein